MSDPHSEYESVRGHYMHIRDRGWTQVRHKEAKTLHIYHIRCHQLSPYQPNIQFCTHCEMHLSEEPVVVAPPREPEHHCPGCKCWEGVR